MAQVTKDSKVGDEFSGKSKTIDWERLWAFSGGPFRLEGWPSRNIHTDPEFAKGSGLPSVAVSGSQFSGNIPNEDGESELVDSPKKRTEDSSVKNFKKLN